MTTPNPPSKSRVGSLGFHCFQVVAMCTSFLHYLREVSEKDNLGANTFISSRW